MDSDLSGIFMYLVRFLHIESSFIYPNRFKRISGTCFNRFVQQFQLTFLIFIVNSGRKLLYHQKHCWDRSALQIMARSGCGLNRISLHIQLRFFVCQGPYSLQGVANLIFKFNKWKKYRRTYQILWNKCSSHLVMSRQNKMADFFYCKSMSTKPGKIFPRFLH